MELAMTEVPVEELGPIDYLIVEFPAGASNFTGEMAAELRKLVDIEHLAVAMDPGSTAGVLVWENTWAAPFDCRSTWAGAGGENRGRSRSCQAPEASANLGEQRLLCR
jgi:hypothetical protein